MNYRYYNFLVLILCYSLADAQTVIPYPDNSLEIATYIEIGIPDPRLKWAGKDYKEAFRFLERIYELDKWSLPRKNSAYSAILFDRMVAKENIDVINDKRIPIAIRLNEAQELSHYVAAIEVLYSEREQKTERFSKELLTAKSFNFSFEKNTMQLVEELNRSLPKHEREESKFQKIYQSFKESLAEECRAWLTNISTYQNRYDKSALLAYAKVSSEITVEIWKYLNIEDQNSILGGMKNLRKYNKYPEMQQEMKSLIKILEK